MLCMPAPPQPLEEFKLITQLLIIGEAWMLCMPAPPQPLEVFMLITQLLIIGDDDSLYIPPPFLAILLKNITLVSVGDEL